MKSLWHLIVPKADTPNKIFTITSFGAERNINSDNADASCEVPCFISSIIHTFIFQTIILAK